MAHSPKEHKEVPAASADKDQLRATIALIEQQIADAQRASVGTEIVIPSGEKIGDLDVGGMTFREVLQILRQELDSYESQADRDKAAAKKAEAPSEGSGWLKGREDLMWVAPSQNPRWEISATQYANEEVRISYLRRGMTLRPGKTDRQQTKTLEPIDDTFTNNEWKVIRRVLDLYEQTAPEVDIVKKKSEDVNETRKEFREILEEENAFRHGRSDKEPTKLPELIKRELDFVAKTNRGFKKELIDLPKLTQDIANILSQLVVLNERRNDGLSRIQKPKKGIKEIPSFALALDKLAAGFQTQLQQNKGMSLILGEAGTGKNELIEYFANSTGRPYFWFPCGRGMEAQDLVNHYEFDSKEGTQRFFTALAQGLQTPGAVVFIDEVNALRPEVQATLHGLGDGNRALNFDGVFVPVAEGVLIIIGGNPAGYSSAGNIGPALLNRTRGQSMVMDYPALKKSELLARRDYLSDAEVVQQAVADNSLNEYACDEALVLYAQFPKLKNLTDRQFTLLWDVLINENVGLRAEAVRDPKLAPLLADAGVLTDLKAILQILQVADNWRRQYEKQDGEFTIGLSMRDTIAITKKYMEIHDVRKAFLQTFDDFRKDPIRDLKDTHASLDKLLNTVLAA